MIARPVSLPRRHAIIAALLVVFGAQQIRWVMAQGYGDWSAFWAAGATAGTSALLDPRRHFAWQKAHHLLTTIFPYLPGTAWLLAPFKALSLRAGYALNLTIMTIAGIAAALLAARTYRIHPFSATLLVFAWAPTMAALATGQIAMIGLLLSVVATFGLASGASVLCGLAVGAMLYKVTYAVPFVLLLAVRRDARALFVVLACGIVWYVVSVAATGGDWQWPAHYGTALHAYFGPDFRQNAEKAVSVSGLLLRAGVPDWPALAVGAVFLVIALPLLARAPVLEAASFTPLLALAFGPHTLPYDAVLALPAIFYIYTHASGPVRTAFMATFYLIAPLWIFTDTFHFDVLAVLCDSLALVWIAKGYYESTASTHLRIAHSGDRSQA